MSATCGDSSQWRYIGKGDRYRVLIAPNKLSFVQSGTQRNTLRVSTLEIVGAASNTRVVPGDRTRSEANYFVGSKPELWRTHVPEYDSVTLQGLSSGIDLRFYERAGQLEFDLMARPGADLNGIQFRAPDQPLQILKDGDLQLGGDSSGLTIHIPSAYQIDNANHQIPVHARFSSRGNDRVALVADHLQAGLPTVIDPTIAFSTFVNSTPTSWGEETYIGNVAVDKSGNIWVAGNTYGPLPDLTSTTSLNCSSPCSYGNYAAVAFAAKFDPSGNLLVSDMLSPTYQNTLGMTLDAQGNIYLDGIVESGEGFPTTPNAYDTGTTPFALTKVFVSKIDSTGNNLVFSTLLGSTSGQNGGAYLSPALGGQSAAGTIAVDSSGDVYVVGASNATDFPVTADAIMGCGPGVCGIAGGNGFLTEFSPDGSKILYSTFIGGSGAVSSQAGVVYNGGVAQNVAVRSDNLVVVAGTTVNANFPVTANALHPTFTECVDYANLGSYGVPQSNFISAIDTTKAGSQGLALSTFVCEQIGQLALDSGNNIYLGVNGNAGSNNAAATPGTFTPLDLANFPYGPGVEEISNDGSQLLKMMWLGVASGPPNSNPQASPGVNAEVQSLSLDAAGDVYMGGMVWVDNYGFPIVGSVQSTLGTATQCDGATWTSSSGCSGVFVVEMNPQLSAPLFATVFGPQGTSPGGEIYETATAVDSSGNIYIAGSTPQTQWPTTAGAQQTAFQSSIDGFLAKITGISPASGVLLSSDHLFFGRSAFAQNTTQTLTIVNDTSSPITIASITGDQNFSAAQNCLGSLAANASCSMAVTFTPRTMGDLQGTLTIADDSATSPHVITAIGSGYMGVGTPASTSVTFPATAVGQSSASQTLLLNNTGNSPLNVSSITATGDFTETDFCQQVSVGVGLSCAIRISFKPAQAGARTGTLSIADDGPGSPHTVALSGIGSGPAASLSVASLTFSAQAVNTTSTAQTVTLTNSGTTSLSITSIAASGDFSETNNCGASLAAGANCSVSVTFAPTVAGARTGTLTFTDNAAGSPQTVSLNGTATAPAPAVSLSPSSLTFPSQAVGSAGAPQSVLLTNSGQAALTIASIAVSGDFSETNTCGTSVAAGANCSISVTFKPASAGARTGSLTINDNVSGSPQTASLTGTGTATPSLSVSPLSLTFASQTVSSSSVAQSVTLTNSGQAAVTFSSIAVSGDFTQTNTCGTTLAAAATCSISVVFTPTVAGARTGTLTISDNVSGSPQSISLAGTGVATNPGPVVSLAPTTLTFTSESVGSSSAAQLVTVSNTGQAALAITSIAASGDFAETNTCGSSVAAASTCTISVVFTPTAAGSRTGAITIVDNAADSPESIALSGTGASVTVTAPNNSGMTISTPGGSATAVLQIGSASGFAGTVNLACAVAFTGTGTPTDPPTCSLNPTQEQVSSGSSANVTLTVNTTGASSAQLLRPLGAGGTLLALALVFFVPRRRWRSLPLLLILALAVWSALTACGGGGGGASSGSGGTQSTGTTAGSYTVTVTASSGSDSASTTIPLSVQ